MVGVRVRVGKAPPGVGVLVLVGVLLGQTAPSSISPSQSLSLPSQISTDGVHPGVGVLVLVGVRVRVGVELGKHVRQVLVISPPQ